MIAKLIHYMHDYWFSRLLRRYFAVILLIMAVPVAALNVMWTYWMNRSFQSEIFSINEQALQRGAGVMENTFQMAKDLTYYVAMNSSVQYMSFQTHAELLADMRKQNIFATITLIRKTYSYIDSIDIYFEKADVVLETRGLLEGDDVRASSWMTAYKAMNERCYVTAVRASEQNFPWLVRLVYPIGGTPGRGCVVVNINMEALGNHLGSGYYRRVGEEPLMAVYDMNSGDLYYLDERRLLRSEAYDRVALEPFAVRSGDYSESATLWGMQFVVSGYESSQSGFRYIYLSPIGRYAAQTRMNRRLIVISAVMSLLLSLVTAMTLALLGYQPIRTLSEALGLSDGRKRPADELAFIRERVRAQERDNRDLQGDLNQHMANLNRAQIVALQAQINPHFISNTLMALSGSVAQIMGTDCETVHALETFAALMRVSLTGDNYLVPLSEELEHIRLFMTLIAFRYKNRVQIEISVPPEMLDVCVPKLSLQPLIENAVNHGLRPRHYRGHIGVRGEMDGETARIIVWDDGVGLSEKEAERLNRLLERDVIGASEHIGLNNVNQRFRLIFGGDAGVSVESQEGHARFALTFPVVRRSGGKLV